MDKNSVILGSICFVVALVLGTYIGLLLSKEPRQTAYPNIQWLACEEGKLCLVYADVRLLDRHIASIQEERLECLHKLVQ